MLHPPGWLTFKAEAFDPFELGQALAGLAASALGLFLDRREGSLASGVASTWVTMYSAK